MIRFLDDWKRFPDAIIDYDTTNTSFLRQAEVYRRMGVKNCAFILTLMQPELKGVDPHDPNLTSAQKAMIGIECKYNPWYYFREVVRIPPVAGPVPLVFKANRGNIALIWSFFCSIDVALIQPRQTGKSVSTDTLMDWLLYIGASNTKINMITKDDTLRKANVERLKKIRDYLPKYLVNITKRDSDNQFELTCKMYENTYTSGVSQNSETTANNLGRGLTAPVTHIDEGPFINYIGVTLPAALASGTTAREEAERYGRPYGNIFTTTAGKKDDRDGRFMYDLIHGGIVWTEALFDAKDRRHLIELVRKNSSGKKLIINATFSHRQLGKTDEWLYHAINEASATGEAADRDFLNVWTSGTQSSPLSVQLNETIRNSELDPYHLEISKDSYIFNWYIPEEEIAETMRTGKFVLGGDTSEAVGQDAIGLVLTDVSNLGVVGAATVNETNLIRFCMWLVQLMVKHANITVIIERKSTGGMIMDYLLVMLPQHGIDPFKRIYNTIVDNSTENKERFREIQTPLERRPQQFYDEHKKYFGFNTTADSRGLLYSTVIQNAAKKAGHLVHDKKLSGEIRGLVVKNGRIDHKASGNDDMVIAWLLTHWFLSHSKNLSYYGIESSLVMRSVSDKGRTLTEEEVSAQARQHEYKAQIEGTYELLKTANNEFMIAKLETRLGGLMAKYRPSEEDAISFDALIKLAREERAAVARQSMRSRQQQNSDRVNDYAQRRRW